MLRETAAVPADPAQTIAEQPRYRPSCAVNVNRHRKPCSVQNSGIVIFTVFETKIVPKASDRKSGSSAGASVEKFKTACVEERYLLRFFVGGKNLAQLTIPTVTKSSCARRHDKVLECYHGVNSAAYIASFKASWVKYSGILQYETALQSAICAAVPRCCPKRVEIKDRTNGQRRQIPERHILLQNTKIFLAPGV